jgi:hypothetical protein
MIWTTTLWERRKHTAAIPQQSEPPEQKSSKLQRDSRHSNELLNNHHHYYTNKPNFSMLYYYMILLLLDIITCSNLNWARALCILCFTKVSASRVCLSESIIRENNNQITKLGACARHHQVQWMWAIFFRISSLFQQHLYNFFMGNRINGYKKTVGDHKLRESSYIIYC